MGRSWPQPGQALFLDEDRDAVFEWLEEEALKCPGCGMPRDETMRKEAHDDFHSKALRCHACATRDRAQHQFTKQEHDPAGLVFSIERRDDDGR